MIEPIQRPDFNDPVRERMPLRVSRPTPYRVVNGRIFSEALELSVTAHCNFTCRSCSHLSPILKKSFLDTAGVERDMRLLSPHYGAEHVRLVGGEPLLHPDLPGLINAIRGSGITDRVRIISNGSLLDRIGPDLWAALDELHISIYPGKEPKEEALEALGDDAARYGKSLVVKRFDKFRETYAAKGTKSRELTQRIYNSCQIAHTWRCHTVQNGYFYLCPQSIFVPRELGDRDGGDAGENGLRITSDQAFARKLLEFLESEKPLPACDFCLGSVGRLFDHVRVPRNTWAGYQDGHIEDLIDRDFLERLEADPDADNGCFEELPESFAEDRK